MGGHASIIAHICRQKRKENSFSATEGIIEMSMYARFGEIRMADDILMKEKSLTATR